MRAESSSVVQVGVCHNHILSFSLQKQMHHRTILAPQIVSATIFAILRVFFSMEVMIKCHLSRILGERKLKVAEVARDTGINQRHTLHRLQ